VSAIPAAPTGRITETPAEVAAAREEINGGAIEGDEREAETAAW
jgi:hypothetical protein